MQKQSPNLLDKTVLRAAAWLAFKKLTPKAAATNPVMFVVLIGTVITAFFTVQRLFAGQPFGFELATTLLLLFTVWFANFAESVAEARGRGQADSLRSAKRALKARRIKNGNEQNVDADLLRKGDRVRVVQGEYVPADGEIVKGVATINESAVTGESAAVLREAGGDHCGVIGGTKVLTGEFEFEVTADPGHSFLDRMIGLVEGAQRQKTPNEMALTVLLAALTMVFILVVVPLPPMAHFMGVSLDYTMLIALLVCLIPTTIGGLLPAIGIAGMNRALAANVVAKSGKAVEVAGDVDTLLLDKTGTITFGDRQATRFMSAGNTPVVDLVNAAVLTSYEDPTPEGKSVLELAEREGYRVPERPVSADYIPFSAETRLSGITLADGTTFVKGASDAITAWADAREIRIPDDLKRLSKRSRRAEAHRWSSPPMHRFSV